MCGPLRISLQVAPASRDRYVFTEWGSSERYSPTLPVAMITPGADGCEYTDPSRVFHVPRCQWLAPCRWSSHVPPPAHEMGLPLASRSGGRSARHAPPPLNETRVLTYDRIAVEPATKLGSAKALPAIWFAMYTPGAPSTLTKSTAPPK